MWHLSAIQHMNDARAMWQQSQLTDGQARREHSTGRYWSEQPEPGTMDEIVECLDPDFGKNVIMPALPDTLQDAVACHLALAEANRRSLAMERALLDAIRKVREARGPSAAEIAEREMNLKLAETMLWAGHAGAQAFGKVHLALDALEQIAPTPQTGYNPRQCLAEKLEPVKRLLRGVIGESV